MKPLNSPSVNNPAQFRQGALPPGTPQDEATNSSETCVWCCPRCRGRFAITIQAACCVNCGATFENVGGILDLRIPGPAWIDFEADRAAARKLQQQFAGKSAAEMIRHVYSNRFKDDAERIELRTREVLAAPGRLRQDIGGWLTPVLSNPGPILDLGCGPGMLMAALAGRQTIGIDVSLVWLVVAQQFVTEHGGVPVLAAAMAESIPLADASVDGVISLDVIEHVGDPAGLLRELDRVTRSGTWVAFSTPNRYSLSAEPHVFVWGVGWLPRSLQSRYVKWRTGIPYEFTRLLSSFELRRLLRRHTTFDSKVRVPKIQTGDVRSRSDPRRAMLVRIYNRMAGWAAIRWIFLVCGPFFQVIARKR